MYNTRKDVSIPRGYAAGGFWSCSPLRCGRAPGGPRSRSALHAWAGVHTTPGAFQTAADRKNVIGAPPATGQGWVWPGSVTGNTGRAPSPCS